MNKRPWHICEKNVLRQMTEKSIKQNSKDSFVEKMKQILLQVKKSTFI